MTKNMCIKSWYGIMKSSNFDCPSSIHNSPSSILTLQSSIFNHPTIFKSCFSNSVKRTGYWTKKVLKITGFLIKCPQAPLAPLASFSRSGWVLGVLDEIKAKLSLGQAWQQVVQIMKKKWQVVMKSCTNYDEIVIKLWTSHEQVKNK